MILAESVVFLVQQYSPSRINKDQGESLPCHAGIHLFNLSALRTPNGPSWCQAGPSWSQVGPSWVRICLKFAQVHPSNGPSWYQVGPNLPKFTPTSSSNNKVTTQLNSDSTQLNLNSTQLRSDNAFKIAKRLSLSIPRWLEDGRGYCTWSCK